ncbi:hypothetical protein DFAR_220009 [Desulfarculales bacterium]
MPPLNIYESIGALPLADVCGSRCDLSGKGVFVASYTPRLFYGSRLRWLLPWFPPTRICGLLGKWGVHSI